MGEGRELRGGVERGNRSRDRWRALAVAWLVATASGSALSASSGRIELQGVVAVVCDIRVVPTPAAGNLDLSQAAQDLSVAVVNEACNDPDGYFVTARSDAGGVLAGESGADAIPYTLAYDGAVAPIESGTAVRVSDAAGPTSEVGVQRDVTISYGAPGFIAAGTYRDVVTFTIAAK